MSYAIHPICERLPKMSAQEFDELKASIRDRGLIDPIELYEGKVLDGRHRLQACEEVGVEPRFVEFVGGDPWMRAWDRNGNRREWPKGAAQKYAVYKILKSGSDEWLALQDEIAEQANKARSEKAQAGEVGRAAAKKKEQQEFSGPTDSGTTKRSHKGKNKGASAKAAAAGVDRGTVEKVDHVTAGDKKTLEAIAAGDLSITEATRQKKREQVRDLVGGLPSGKYRVIYADPPWSYGNSGLDNYGHAEAHYPPMSISQLCELDVKSLCADNAVLFLWVTSPLLEDCFDVIRAWGFKYKTSFVWDKVKHNFGHYNSVRHELLLIATRGSCVPDSDNLIDSVQEIERSDRHSEKPEEFRKIIDTLYVPQEERIDRIELFRRGDAPACWHVWGNEANADGILQKTA